MSQRCLICMPVSLPFPRLVAFFLTQCLLSLAVFFRPQFKGREQVGCLKVSTMHARKYSFLASPTVLLPSILTRVPSLCSQCHQCLPV